LATEAIHQIAIAGFGCQPLIAVSVQPPRCSGEIFAGIFLFQRKLAGSGYSNGTI